MTTATATRTTRESLENMVRIETDTLNWQRANDEPYSVIMATMSRILELNTRIADMGMRRTTSFGYNGR